MFILSTKYLRRYECVSLGLDKEILLAEDKIHKNRFCIISGLPKVPRHQIDFFNSEMLEAVFLKEMLMLGQVEIGSYRHKEGHKP